MEWIGCIMIVLYTYILQLMEFQMKYERGVLSPLDANDVVRSRTARFFTVVIGLIWLGIALALLIFSCGWWTPIYVIASLLIGGLIRGMTGNPLIG